MTDQFDPPDKIVGIDLHHFLGALVLIRPNEVRLQQKTRFGLADATVADIHVLDGPGAGHCVRNTMIWPKVLQGALATAVGTGRFKLGRITQGEAALGQDPPWILSDPNEQDAVVARRYLASEVYHRNAGINVSGPDRPAPTPAPASAAPWGAAGGGGVPMPPVPPAPAPAPAAAPPWGAVPGDPILKPAPGASFNNDPPPF